MPFLDLILTSWVWPVFLLLLTVIYFTGAGVYNLYLHPLAKFPGPKLAAATKLYEFYYDVVHDGQFFKEIQRMHAVYGPIVRINPQEIHVNDATFYETLYAGGAHKRDKYTWFTRAGGSPMSSFATEQHNLHRVRRGALNPLFSKQSVTRLEPLIHRKVDLICDGMQYQFQQGTAFDFGAAYMSFALDTVSHYAFGESECWNCLLDPDFAPQWKEAIIACFESATALRYAPWVLGIVNKVPHQLIAMLNKPLGLYMESATMVKNTVSNFLSSEATGNVGSKDTIFAELRHGDGKLPEVERQPQRLLDEANILIAAGGEAITQLLTITSYHLLDNPDMLARLCRELKTVMPEPDTRVTWTQLERLPYLTAVIQEGLRISAIVTTRLPRSAPDEVLQYGEYNIPPGTPVSMTSHFIHLDPALWPEPLKFEPERWTAEESTIAKGKREFLVPFSKGTRGCLGINLAHAQAYIALAKIFRRFDFALYETSRKDVTIVRDCFNGQPYKGCKGVRAKVVGVRD